MFCPIRPYDDVCIGEKMCNIQSIRFQFLVDFLLSGPKFIIFTKSIQRTDWNHSVDVFCRQKVGFWMSETQGQCSSPIDCQFHGIGEFAIKEAKNLFWIAYGKGHGCNHSV